PRSRALTTPITQPNARPRTMRFISHSCVCRPTLQSNVRAELRFLEPENLHRSAILAPSNLLPVSETNRQWGFYMYGKGVARDYAEAKRQFKQGADLGRGFCHERARG